MRCGEFYSVTFKACWWYTRTESFWCMGEFCFVYAIGVLITSTLFAIILCSELQRWYCIILFACCLYIIQAYWPLSISLFTTIYCACHFDGHQTFVQHCRAPDSLPPAVLNCDSLLSNPDLKLICFLLLSANYSTYLFRQRLCSRLTALRRFITLLLLFNTVIIYKLKPSSYYQFL